MPWTIPAPRAVRNSFVAAALLLASGALLAAETASLLEGPALDQGRTLLRPVQRYGHLGPARDLPPVLERALTGREALPTAAQLAAAVQARSLSPSELGGDPGTPIAMARYFVIHDTSYPYYGDEPLPDCAVLESPEWKGNDLRMWEKIKVTHVYVNRRGESVTARDFSQPQRATKYERQNIPGREGLFLHVELVQPRRRDPRGGPKNDALAPNPGFTAPQLQRLAQLYVAGSVRRGAWLIPAFHAAVDAGIPDAHDDPQSFSLEDWATALEAELRAVRS